MRRPASFFRIAWIYLRCIRANRWLLTGYTGFLFGTFWGVPTLLVHDWFMGAVDAAIAFTGLVLLCMIRFGVPTTLRSYLRTMSHYDARGYIDARFEFIFLDAPECNVIGFNLAVADIIKKRGGAENLVWHPPPTPG